MSQTKDLFGFGSTKSDAPVTPTAVQASAAVSAPETPINAAPAPAPAPIVVKDPALEALEAELADLEKASDQNKAMELNKKLLKERQAAFKEDNGSKWVKILEMMIAVEAHLLKFKLTIPTANKVADLATYLGYSLGSAKDNISLAIFKLFFDAQSDDKKKDQAYYDSRVSHNNIDLVLCKIANEQIRNEIIKMMLSFYTKRYDVNMVTALVQSNNREFNFDLHSTVVQDAIAALNSAKEEADKTNAKTIFSFLLEQLPLNQTNETLFKVLNSHTRLTCAIVIDAAMASQLIKAHSAEHDSGVFLVDQKGRSPLFWARQQPELQKDLKECYEKQVPYIADMLLKSDARVFKEPEEGKTEGGLVTGLVNDFLGLKEKLFDELNARVENNETTCDQLRQLQVTLNNPKSPIVQFFNIGHGGAFQPASPWPAKFATLSHKIEDTLAAANSVADYSSSDESDSSRDDQRNVIEL